MYSEGVLVCRARVKGRGGPYPSLVIKHGRSRKMGRDEGNYGGLGKMGAILPGHSEVSVNPFW